MIDVHQHVNWQGKDHKGLIKFLKESGFKKCWLLSLEAIDGGLDPNYFHLSANVIYEIYKMYPKKIIPFCAIDPRRENAVEILKKMHKKGFKGYGEIKIRILIENPDMIKMLKTAGSLNMPAVLHFDTYLDPETNWYLGSIDNLERAAKKCKKTNLIAHGPGFWREIFANSSKTKDMYPKADIKKNNNIEQLLKNTDNVFADLSGFSGFNAISRDKEYTKSFFDKFYDKIIYGTDKYTTETIDFIKSLNLSKKVFNSITKLNAEQLIDSK